MGTDPKVGWRLFEREFLGLATSVLACRFQIMTGRQPSGCGKQFVCATDWETMQYSMLGEIDNAGEMRLLCQELINGRAKAGA